jgi:hypothetical protein
MVISSAIIQILINSTGTKTLDLSVPQDNIAINDSNSFVDGAGALSAEGHYSDTVRLADGASTELDLSGILADAFGDTVVGTKLKALYLKNKSTDSGLIYGHSAANGVPILNAAALANAGGILIPPGGQDIKIAVDADGWAITAGTGDLLKLEHDSAGAAAADEVQTFVADAASTAGSYTILLQKPDGTTVTTAAIAWDASLATVQTAITLALDAVAGWVASTAGSAVPFSAGPIDLVLTASGTGYAETDFPMCSVDPSALTSVTTITGNETTPGHGVMDVDVYLLFETS